MILATYVAAVYWITNYSLLVIPVASSADVRTGLYRLIFYPNKNSIKVKIAIRDDKLVEGTEAFGVQLIVPDHHKRNGLRLGNPSHATVFIKDGRSLCMCCFNLLINYSVVLKQMTNLLPNPPLNPL